MQFTFIATEDGSLSCRDEETGELYHNRAGAFTEAQVNYFVPSDVQDLLEQKRQVLVLDSCFGLGYNTWVLLSNVLKNPIAGSSIHIIALENDQQILPAISEVLKDVRFKELRRALNKLGKTYQAEAGCFRFITDTQVSVCLEIVLMDLRQAVPGLTNPADLVFHDPFSPKRVPELWTVDLFQQYHRLLKPMSGKLLTYSTASAVTAGLLEAGFYVYRTPAVGGKSGGTLASVLPQQPDNAKIFALSPAELDKLKSAAGIPYRDKGFNNGRDQIGKIRQQEQADWHLSALELICGAKQVRAK